MGLIKIFILSFMIILSSCSLDISQDDVNKVKEVFSEQLDNLYQLYETKGKALLSDLSVEKAEEMLNEVLSKIPEDKKQLIYKGVEKGVTLLENGKEILADELSIDVSLEGVQEEIEKFVESLSGIDARVSVDNVNIEKTDDNYKLDCTVNFFYNTSEKSQEGSLTTVFTKSTK